MRLFLNLLLCKMNFFSVALIIGFCVIFKSAEGTSLTVYGYYNEIGKKDDKRIAFQPSKINEKSPFRFQGVEFSESEPNYYSRDFLLVYRADEEAKKMDALVIRGGLRNILTADDKLKKYLLSEDHSGFTPSLSVVYGWDFYGIPTVGKNVNVNQEIPVLHINTRANLTKNTMLRNSRVLGKYSISSSGVTEV